MVLKVLYNNRQADYHVPSHQDDLIFKHIVYTKNKSSGIELNDSNIIYKLRYKQENRLFIIL